MAGDVYLGDDLDMALGGIAEDVGEVAAREVSVAGGGAVGSAAIEGRQGACLIAVKAPRAYVGQLVEAVTWAMAAIIINRNALCFITIAKLQFKTVTIASRSVCDMLKTVNSPFAPGTGGAKGLCGSECQRGVSYSYRDC